MSGDRVPIASSACSAPTGTTSSSCPASRNSSPLPGPLARTSPIPVPGNVSYNGYMCTRELLRAIERAGSTNNIAVIKQLEQPQDLGRRPHAELRRVHESGHAPAATDDLHGAPQRPTPVDKTDLFDIMTWTKPEDALDSREDDLRLQARDLRRDADVRAVIADVVNGPASSTLAGFLLPAMP